MSKDKDNTLKGKLPPPRNPVAQQLPQKSGGGRHSNKREQERRGESKHRKKDVDLSDSYNSHLSQRLNEALASEKKK